MWIKKEAFQIFELNRWLFNGPNGPEATPPTSEKPTPKPEDNPTVGEEDINEEDLDEIENRAYAVAQEVLYESAPLPKAASNVELCLNYLSEKPGIRTSEELIAFASSFYPDIPSKPGFKAVENWQTQVAQQREAADRYRVMHNVGTKEEVDQARRWVNANAESPFDPAEIKKSTDILEAGNANFDDIMAMIVNNEGLLGKMNEVKKAAIIEYLTNEIQNMPFQKQLEVNIKDVKTNEIIVTIRKKIEGAPEKIGELRFALTKRSEGWAILGTIDGRGKPIIFGNSIDTLGKTLGSMAKNSIQM